MDAINTLMLSNTSLFGAIILVGFLAYLGTNGIDPSHAALHRFVSYLAGAALVLIGELGAYFGASKELALYAAHAFVIDMFSMEWLAVGVIAIIVGFLIVRHAFHRD